MNRSCSLLQSKKVESGSCEIPGGRLVRKMSMEIDVGLITTHAGFIKNEDVFLSMLNISFTYGFNRSSVA